MADTQFIRQKKEKNYTVLDNTFIQDCELSWKAKGLMTYLLSLPEDWAIYLSELEKHATDGKDSLRSAIKELEEKGYLEKTQNINNGKFAGYSYTIYEIPLRKNRSGKTVAEKPFTENPQLLNTNNIQSTNIQNISTTKKTNVKHKNGKYKNVLLTDNELEKLCKELGSEKAKDVINYFSELKEMKGYKYKSDYLAINKWGIQAYNEKGIKKSYTSRYDNAGMHVDKNHDYSQDGGKVDENGMIGF